MVDYKVLVKFLMFVARLPSERMEALSDLTAILASDRVSHWRDAVSLYKRRKPYQVKMTNKEKEDYASFYAEGGNKLDRMIRIIEEAAHFVLPRLSFIAERMLSADGDQWCRELRKLLRGDLAWKSLNPEPSYLRFYSGLLYKETNIHVYERRRAGTNQETFQSLRGGDVRKVCFSSEKIGVWFCSDFKEQLCAISDNKVVLFLFHNPHIEKTGKTYVVYTDMNPEGPAVAGITYPLELDSWIWTPEDRVRRIVLTCEHR